MRVHGRKGQMGKRFAIVIGVAAAGVMALGAQTAAAVVKYDTKLTITHDRGAFYHGKVKSDRDRNPVYHPARAVRKCMEGRRVILFKQRPGADRRLGTDRSDFRPGYGVWAVDLDHAVKRRVYGKVLRKVRDRFVCRAVIAFE
jgi:hypothetical protein